MTELAQNANGLREQRQTQVASLNALIDRPSDASLESAHIPARLVRAALPDSDEHIHFASNVFGASVSDSLLPSLATMQAIAIANSPMLREHEASIAAQTARVSLAEKATKPDVDLSIQYGQRNGLTDMISAIISLPVPIQGARKQGEDAAAARAELAALEAEHHADVNDLRARVAKLYADLGRERTQIALDVKAILPQGRAALASLTSSYQGGRGDLLGLLDGQSTLLAYETSYYRTLSDFGETLAELDQVVGKEVLP
ncbi:MAG: TolC family protein [Gemmatimonadaceae bacterium]